MVCDNCDSEVDDSTVRCPNCGYDPRRALIASGLAYTVLGYVFAFVVFGLSIVTLSTTSIAASMLGILVGISIGLYGIWLAFAGTKATVSNGLDAYLLPVLH